MTPFRMKIAFAVFLVLLCLPLISALTLSPAYAYDTYTPIIDSSYGISPPTYSIFEDGNLATMTETSSWIIWDFMALKSDCGAFEIKMVYYSSDAYCPGIFVSQDKATWYQISIDFYADITPIYWRTITIPEAYNDVQYVKATFTNYWAIDAVRLRTYPYTYTDGVWKYASNFVDQAGISGSLGTGIGKHNADASFEYFWIGATDHITFNYSAPVTSGRIFVDKGSGSSACTIFVNVSMTNGNWVTAGSLPTTTETLNYVGTFQYIKFYATDGGSGGTWEVLGFALNTTAPIYPFYVSVLNSTHGYALPSGVLNHPGGYNLALTATPYNASAWYFYAWNIAGSERVGNPYTYIVTKNITIYPVFKAVSSHAVTDQLNFIFPLLILIGVGGIAIIMAKGNRLEKIVFRNRGE